MAWNNPFSPARTIGVVDLAGLSSGSGSGQGPVDGVLDLGCGAGDLLLALAQRGIGGRGIDSDEAAIAEARRTASALPPAHRERCRFEVGDVRDPSVLSPPGSYALVACIGATYAYAWGAAALPAALEAIAPLVRPHGHALIGAGYHRQPVPPDYAAFLGEHTGIERSHAQNVEICEAAGWECVHAITAGVEEWDAFEWSHYRRKNRRTWRDAYLRWGRDVMGFALYLLRAEP